MRYLTENNDYQILYGRVPFVSSLEAGTICGVLIDKHTGEKLIEEEYYYNTNLEPCLMKLGKRLIKKWQKTKK